ncbi:thiopeptide-type bacteriocin biosynthesis protein [Curtobacterium sp. MCBD17_019]|uniref:thiopeptide-type bacteriocin biosynthesis protein n=1 Tax=Curtobacterium sp. MCBD17_019 TaxID=2175669 RepID=UPI000DA90FF2|nr:thiopeptide-type bacteriocin biosynthesis protein [Curtobacterium sp. MCBD17_019]PZE78428.1 hypothetical protein DEI82_01280 [Curtobacterium sp. MCBD17_019]
MSTTWTYWKIDAPAGTVDHLILRLQHVVDTMIGPGANWHFLRYVDHSGPHVRFRVCTTSDLADRLHLARLELGHPVRPELYEPETGKWGTTVGVTAAERVFNASSRLAVEALRSGCLAPAAQQVFTRAAEQLVPDVRTRVTVLRTHAAWWLGATSPSSERVDAALASVRRVAAVPDDRTLGRDGTPNDLGHLVEQFIRALEDAMRSPGTGHPATYHFHQHLHLTMNRLGLDPAGEARAALLEVARLEATAEGSR